jgi:DNA-binding CsgD family transcriptional regulator
MVKKNVGSILRKLGARNRTEASRLAREALLV